MMGHHPTFCRTLLSSSSNTRLSLEADAGKFRHNVLVSAGVSIVQECCTSVQYHRWLDVIRERRDPADKTKEEG